MGMSINEAIETFLYTRSYGTADIAKRVAIDTMRKYQKITAIMLELNGDFYGSYLKDRQALEKIYEVVKDVT